MPLWLTDGPDDDVVISTRIRLARNIAGIPFRPAPGETEHIRKIKEAAVAALNEKGESDFALLEMKGLTNIQKQSLIERHLISRELAQNPEGALLLGRDEALSIMILEEDHYRLQCLKGGFQLENAYAMADALDEMLSKHVTYAFDEKLGYLTSCPTNVGTGLRASVMMHLPALCATSSIGGVLAAIGKIGLTARGIMGEGTGAAGSMFQVSNQVTLGFSEKEILENLRVTAGRMIESERQARQTIQNAWGNDLEDRVYRSLGVLKTARRLDTDEMLRHASDVNLGVATGLIQGIDYKVLYGLLMDTRPAMLMETGGEMPPVERDMKRAGIVREALKDVPC